MDNRELEAVRLLAHTLVEAGKYGLARDLLLGLIEANPDELFARRNLALCQLRLGEYEAAEPVARRLAGEAAGAERAPALFFHAHALWGMGKMEECRTEVERYAAALAEAESPNAVTHGEGEGK